MRTANAAVLLSVSLDRTTLKPGNDVSSSPAADGADPQDEPEERPKLPVRHLLCSSWIRPFHPMTLANTYEQPTRPPAPPTPHFLLLLLLLCSLVVSDPRLGGDVRFASSVARRLQSLGAITRGDVDFSSAILDLKDWNIGECAVGVGVRVGVRVGVGAWGWMREVRTRLDATKACRGILAF